MKCTGVEAWFVSTRLRLAIDIYGGAPTNHLDPKSTRTSWLTVDQYLYLLNLKFSGDELTASQAPEGPELIFQTKDTLDGETGTAKEAAEGTGRDQCG